jgi:hypothetical protein
MKVELRTKVEATCTEASMPDERNNYITKGWLVQVVAREVGEGRSRQDTGAYKPLCVLCILLTQP